jgi:hypothetical protein
MPGRAIAPDWSSSLVESPVVGDERRLSPQRIPGLGVGWCGVGVAAGMAATLAPPRYFYYELSP